MAEGLSMEKVNQYLKDLKFKKCRIGGCDEEGVLKSISTICEMYDDELKKKNEDLDIKTKLIKELEITLNDYESLQKKNQSLTEEIQELKRLNTKYQLEKEKVMATLASIGDVREEVLRKAEQEASKKRIQVENDIQKLMKDAGNEISDMRDSLYTLTQKKVDIMNELELIVSFCKNTQRMVEQLKEATEKNVPSDVKQVKDLITYEN